MFAANSTMGRIATPVAGLLAVLLLSNGNDVIGPGEAYAAQNCAEKPRKCGYPDAGNTGPKAYKTKKKKNGKKKRVRIEFKRVPNQVKSGKGWRWDSRGFVSIDGDGTVFENYYVDGTVDVNADNVTIKNVRVYEGGESFGIAVRHADNTRIIRALVGPKDGQTRLANGIVDVYGDAQNMFITRSEIYGTKTGIQIYRGRITHNYIHDMRYKSGDHVNGIMSNGSRDKLVIHHNTIFNELNQTDAIGLFQDFGVEANRTVTKNLIAGGGYTIYGGEARGDRASYNIKIQKNRFSNLFYTRSGYYGHGTAFNRHGSGNTWIGNVWDHNGNTVPVP